MNAKRRGGKGRTGSLWDAGAWALRSPRLWGRESCPLTTPPCLVRSRSASARNAWPWCWPPTRRLYCSTGDIGMAVVAHPAREGWGVRTIDRLSHDLREAFPDMRGFSPRNFKYNHGLRRRLARARNRATHRCTDSVAQQSGAAAQARPPGEAHMLRPQGYPAGLDPEMLELQIRLRLYERHGRAVTNFPWTLPPSDSELSSSSRRRRSTPPSSPPRPRRPDRPVPPRRGRSDAPSRRRRPPSVCKDKNRMRRVDHARHFDFRKRGPTYDHRFRTYGPTQAIVVACQCFPEVLPQEESMKSLWTNKRLYSIISQDAVTEECVNQHDCR